MGVLLGNMWAIAPEPAVSEGDPVAYMALGVAPRAAILVELRELTSHLADRERRGTFQSPVYMDRVDKLTEALTADVYEARSVLLRQMIISIASSPRDEAELLQCTPCGRSIPADEVVAPEAERVGPGYRCVRCFEGSLRHVVVTCLACGRWMVLSRFATRRRYCSQSCRRFIGARRQRSRRAEARALAPVEFPCEFCSERFAPTRSDARFCSGRCRVAAHRRRRATTQG